MRRSSLGKLLATQPAPVGELVSFAPLAAGQKLPLCCRPTQPGVVLGEWLGTHQEPIRELVNVHGAILFRDFAVVTAAEFAQVVTGLGGERVPYGDRSSPRSKVTDWVYTSTDHPPDQSILFHNELAYSTKWPLDLFFCCMVPPTTGGETPIADSREIYQRLRPATRERFAALGVSYERYMGGGLGLDWKEVFQVQTREQAEQHCKEQGFTFEWDGEALRTRRTRPAVRTHPRTGEPIFFNHGYFFNQLSLPPTVQQTMLQLVGPERMPFQTRYGDGSPIEPAVITEIAELYAEVGVVFPWQRGDVLYIDNMLVAHARKPFAGERQILVAMSNAVVG